MNQSLSGAKQVMSNEGLEIVFKRFPYPLIVDIRCFGAGAEKTPQLHESP
jgi:hypothetical protein